MTKGQNSKKGTDKNKPPKTQKEKKQAKKEKKQKESKVDVFAK